MRIVKSYRISPSHPSVRATTYRKMRWQLFGLRGQTSDPDHDGASSSSSGPAAPGVNRWDAIFQDEERYQELQYPTPEELPGCMSIMYVSIPDCLPSSLACSSCSDSSEALSPVTSQSSHLPCLNSIPRSQTDSCSRDEFFICYGQPTSHLEPLNP